MIPRLSPHLATSEPHPRVRDQLEEIARRPASTSLAEEVRTRIELLNRSLFLNSTTRQAAFADVFNGFVSDGFDIRLRSDAQLRSEGNGTIAFTGEISLDGNHAATITRVLRFEAGIAVHKHMRVDRELRGAALGTGLISTSLRLYDRLGFHRVVLTAAATGRWHWAQCGFDFATPDDRDAVKSHFERLLLMLGIDVDLAQVKRAQEFALLGRDPLNEVKVSFDDFIEAAGRSAVLGGDDFAAGVRETAESNKLAMNEPIPIGKLGFLLGPSWDAKLDLAGPERAVFESYYASRVHLLQRSNEAADDPSSR